MTPSSDPFKSRFGGICGHCEKTYRPGDRIVGQGKGRRALHAECAPVAGMVVRQMTDEGRAKVGRKF